MKKHTVKIIERSMLFALAFSLALSFAKFSASCDTMRKNIQRIHIIANSDLKADQDVKLKVRDAIVGMTNNIFEDCESIIDAEKITKAKLTEIRDVGKKTLAENGFSYNCSAKVARAYFDTREYDGFTLPAGEYDSLILTLGEGRGHNWWCVIYPSVCIGGSKANLKKIGKASDAALDPKKYKIRFKAVEWYEQIKKSLGK